MTSNNYRRIAGTSISVLVLIVCGAIPVFGQGAQSPKPPGLPVAAQTLPLDLGTLNGVDYTNNAFGLSLSIPRDWIVVSAQRQSEVKEQSKQMVSDESEAKREQMRRSMERSTVLLSLTKFPPEQPSNASFMLVAERVNPLLIKSGVDALVAMRNTAQGSKFNLEFQGGIRTERIGNTEFGTATIKNTSPHGVFMQKVYMVIKNGYGLEFFFTYLSDSDVVAFDTIMKSVKLK